MTTGRKPVPTALKILHGTQRPDRYNGDEPKPEVMVPPCPDHLNELAKAEWNRLAPELAALKVLTNWDAGALAAYCQSYADWTEAVTEYQKTGQVVRSPQGFPQVNPWKSIANEALRQMRAYGAELGLSPASRVRIAVPPATGGEAASRWAGLLA